jgi:hypothetical protein
MAQNHQDDIKEIMAEMLEQMREANELLATQRRINEDLFKQIDELVDLQRQTLQTLHSVVEREFNGNHPTP